MEEVIRTEGLSKSYGDVKAVSEISLNVRKGEMYGFLGLNGAGKTTTIRMLLGMINPDSGKAYIDGNEIKRGKYGLWNKVGYLVEVPYSYPELTVRENLEIIRRLRIIRDAGAVDSVIEKLSLNSYSNRKARNLSLGNKQRLGLAKALIHNPDILILDEPANGLDPAGILEIRELLTDLATNHGVTVLISSHILGEISKFSTRIGIIHNGRLIQELNTPQLEELCRKTLILKTRDNVLAKNVLNQNGIESFESTGDLLEIRSTTAIDKPEEIATLLVNNNIPPVQLVVTEEDLESYFLRTIGCESNINNSFTK